MYCLENELAWAAGFFDGEGYCGYIPRANKDCITPRVTLTIAQNNIEVLNRFKNALMVGQITGPYNNKGNNSKEYYTYSVGKFEDIEKIYNDISPYLSSIKKNQIKNALEKFGDYHNRTHCKNNHELTEDNRYFFKGRNNGCRQCRVDVANNRWSKNVCA